LIDVQKSEQLFSEKLDFLVVGQMPSSVRHFAPNAMAMA
jgi:hypothetical protein